MSTVAGEREESLLEPGDEDDRELESLGVVQRHEHHGVGVGIERIHGGHEGGALEEVVERGEPDLPQVIGDGLGGGRDEFAHVLQSVLRIGAVGTEVGVVADRFHEGRAAPRPPAPPWRARGGGR